MRSPASAAGGYQNSADGDYGSASGGEVNRATGSRSNLAGGDGNDAAATGSTIVGANNDYVDPAHGDSTIAACSFCVTDKPVDFEAEGYE
jgi:hypothetical protein